jgi:hypothetical protein
MLIGQTTNVKFKVNVMGTSADPKVRVILGTKPELSFPAEKQGDDWAAELDIPNSVASGKYDLRVEVMVGNRHFTPLTKQVELFGPEVVAAPNPTPEPADEPAGESTLFQQDEIKERSRKYAETMAKAVCAPVEEEEVAVEEAPVVAEEPAIVEPPAPVIQRKITLPPDFFKNLTAPSAPVKVEYQPIIAREAAHAAMDKPIKAAETKKPKAKKLVELKHELPVRLIKGEIVYE